MRIRVLRMYYYASKLSSIACGTRCRHTVRQQRNQRDRNKGRHKTKSNDDDSDDETDAKALSPVTSTLLNGGDKIILGTSSELPEYSCDNAPDIPNTAMGTGGIMYLGGHIVSGPQDSLVDLLLPNNIEDLDKEFAFSFLLSSRLFIRPHELLGRLLLNVPEEEPLDRLVALLNIWTNTFPYDFRDERIMCHVKHIVARCANTGLGDVVSELLSALLNRLTELEQHEKELRACQSLVDETELIKWPSATQLAQVLCRIERKLAKHIGPEEFVQCSSTVHITRNKKSDSKPSASGCPGGQDSKKTCNLESYLDWSAKLRLLVSNEILLCNGIRDRSKVVELWSGVAQYCLLVGNNNSATVILESLESPAIARLQAKELNLIFERPIIDLESQNPKLYIFVQNISLIHKLRENLNHMRKYLNECRFAASNKLVEVGLKRYLVQSTKLYSISDLSSIDSGVLIDYLNKVYHTFDKHIRSCDICTGKGYLCEICSNNEVIFPYDDAAVHCTKFLFFFHRACWIRKSNKCPKCIRIEERKLKVVEEEIDGIE